MGDGKLGFAKKEEDILKRVPAIAELRLVSKRYGLELTNQEASSIIDEALERKTESGMRESVRTQLFSILCAKDPERAIKIELRYYKKQGYAIDEGIVKRAVAITKREFESDEEARIAYRRASQLIKESLPKREDESEGREERVAGKTKGSEKKGKSPQEIKIAGITEKELARMAFMVLEMNSQLTRLSGQLGEIYDNAITEHLRVQGISRSQLANLYKSDARNAKRIADAAITFAENSFEYTEKLRKLEETFEKRNAILRGLGFTSTDTRFFASSLGPAQFIPIRITDSTQLKANIAMFGAFVAPILLRGIDNKTIPELEKVLAETGKRDYFKGVLRDGMLANGALIAGNWIDLVSNEAEIVTYIKENYQRYRKPIG